MLCSCRYCVRHREAIRECALARDCIGIGWATVPWDSAIHRFPGYVADDEPERPKRARRAVNRRQPLY